MENVIKINSVLELKLNFNITKQKKKLDQEKSFLSHTHTLYGREKRKK